MPAVPPGSLILVTGASGFIAVETVKTLLAAGFPVRGTVRSKEKGEYLADLFKDAGAPFEYVVVEDIAEPGAFDEAVKGVVGVAHTASPFHFNVTSAQQLIKPAVQGTVGVLESLKKNNPDVKRVVVTSSCAAIMDESVPRPNVRTEKDWNEHSLRQVEEKGDDASPGDIYRASKTLAERAFWKFIEDEKPAFDGATICPPMVYGPISQQISSKEQLNTSNQNILLWFTGNKTAADIPDFAPFNWVDVRDIALAHLRALTVPEAGGERFIVGAGPCSPNDVVLVFEKYWPERTTYPKGDASRVAAIHGASTRHDGSKAERVLGIKYHTLDQTVKDTIDSLVERLGV